MGMRKRSPARLAPWSPVVRLSIGHRTPRLPVRTSRARRVRLAALLLAAGAATASVASSPEGLSAESRGGRARDLTDCGRTRACLMKRRAQAEADGLSASSRAGRSRWSEKEYDRVTVWIGPGEGTRNWRPANRDMARDAFHAWTAAGAPVRFVFVPDSARADVRVLWRDSLPEGRAGQATRYVDRRGWLRAATIELTLGRPSRRAPRPSAVRAIALHEVGHLLGLEHSDDERDIMAAWVTARLLTPNDLSAMRALYHVADPVRETLAGGDSLTLGRIVLGDPPAQ
jgi:Matrixin